MPELEAVYQANKDKGLIIIGIVTSDNLAAVQKVINNKKITFPILIADDKVQDQFDGEGTPETFVMSTEGNITEHIKGARDQDFFIARASQLLTQNN